MANVWALDLNIESQKTIKQGGVSVQTALNELGGRPRLGSRFQEPEPDQRSENAGLHSARPKVPCRLQNADNGNRAKARECFSG
jgi:hypothetical protein